jgi:CHAT domain-containing protein
VSEPEALLPDALLIPCAILPWFDHHILVLGGADEYSARTLLASTLVVPADDPTGAFQLHPDLREAILSRLDAANGTAQLLALHSEYIGAILSRLGALPHDQRGTLIRERCFTQLMALLHTLNLRREWRQMGPLLALAAAAGFSQPPQQHRLTYYDGLVAIRDHRYAEGQRVLMDLASSHIVADEVRMLAWNAVGLSHMSQAQYDRALLGFWHANELARAVSNLEYEGLTLLNISMTHNELGEYQQALELAKTSLSMFRTLKLPHREAHALYEIGNTALQLGRWHDAQEHIYEAIARYQELEATHGLAALYWAQGLLHHVLGDVATSQAAYEQALLFAGMEEHHDPAVLMDVHTYLGLLHQSEGQIDRALAAYTEALRLATHVHNDHAWVVITYRIGTIHEQSGQSELAMDAYGRAIALLETLRSSLESIEVKIGLLGTTQQIYEAIVQLCVKRGLINEAFAYVERARSRAFLDLLAGRLPELYGAGEATVTAPVVQSQLPGDAMIVEYFTVGVLPREERLITRLPPENLRLRALLTHRPQIYIFALTSGRLEVYRPELDPNRLQPSLNDPSPGSRLLSGQMLSYLYTALIAPLAHLYETCQTVYIVPHGPLHYIPFGALCSADYRPLVAPDRPALALAPSATILLRAMRKARVGGANDISLAVGYNDVDHAIRLAEAEAHMVSELVGGESWIGEEASIEKLRAVGGRLRMLHIAGHAEVNHREPLASALVIGDGKLLSGYTIMETLRLSAEHVTVSACTSGLSRIVPGDEQLGLPRAFLYAGATSVLCTLWEAADRVALLIMDCFYRSLHQGLSPAVALRNAQIAVRQMTAQNVIDTLGKIPVLAAELGVIREELAGAPDAFPFDDPFYWAPFVLVGGA